MTWRGKNQSIVARSSVEVEFRVAAFGIYELLQLKKLLEDLRIPSEEAIKLYYDNKATINIIHNPIQHDRTKDVKVDCHFIKEKSEAGLIYMPYVPIEEQLANFLRGGIE